MAERNRVKEAVRSAIRTSGAGLQSVISFVLIVGTYTLIFFLHGVTWVITKIRYYDPKISEKTKCPACGWRQTRFNFVRTLGIEKGSIEHTCLRCGALFYSALLVPAEQWLSPLPVNDRASKMKRAVL